MRASMPSDHSCVSGSMSPYSCPIVTAFGLIECLTTGLSLFSSSRAVASVYNNSDLPENAAPTSINPWRTWKVWKSCTALASNSGAASIYLREQASRRAFRSEEWSGVLLSLSGKRSVSIARKRGTSSATNLGTQLSEMDL
jgi:hypothetical protein